MEQLRAGNNFTLQRPSMAGDANLHTQQSRANYYVDAEESKESPMRREMLQNPPGYVGHAPPPHSKYYQTFNDSRNPHRPQEEYGASSAQDASQLSPSYTSASNQNRMANSQMVVGAQGNPEASLYGQEENRTDYLRNFMEVAQPGDWRSSQGPASHLSGLSTQQQMARV